METILGFLHQGVSVVVPFVVLLGVLIFVHELGHFSVAKFFGVRVETFSLGFGRKIFQKKYGDTTYCLSLIPFGGYVKMYGDEMRADIPKEEQRYSFSHQPVIPRIAIVLAGPFMNAIFAGLLFIVIAGVGEESLRPKLGDIAPQSAAYTAGFRTDDVIKSVNGVSIDRWDNLKKAIEDNKDRPVSFVVQRDDKEVPLTATPTSVANKNILSSQAQVGDIEGLSYLSHASAIGISDPKSAPAVQGLKTGDIIRKVNGKEINKWEELVASMSSAAALKKDVVELEVERDAANASSSAAGKTIHITYHYDMTSPMKDLEQSDLYLSSVVTKSAAAAAGIQANDRLVSINGKKLLQWDDVVKTVQAYKESEGPLKVDYIRDGKAMSASIVPKMMKQTDGAGNEQQNFALGIVTGLVYANPDTFLARETSFGPMIHRGLEDTAHWIDLTALSFVRLAQGRVSSKSIGGPLMIGKLASETWRIGISPFLKIMGIISINLFLLNLLPIPVLDGGHLLFFVIELVKGSPLSFKKMEIMQQVGIFLLLALMVFSMFNDIVRLFAPS